MGLDPDRQRGGAFRISIENCLPLLEGQAVFDVAVRRFVFCDQALNAGDRSTGGPALYYEVIS
jgi:hypothetical protein